MKNNLKSIILISSIVLGALNVKAENNLGVGIFVGSTAPLGLNLFNNENKNGTNAGFILQYKLDQDFGIHIAYDNHNVDLGDYNFNTLSVSTYKILTNDYIIKPYMSFGLSFNEYIKNDKKLTNDPSIKAVLGFKYFINEVSVGAFLNANYYNLNNQIANEKSIVITPSVFVMFEDLSFSNTKTKIVSKPVETRKPLVIEVKSEKKIGTVDNQFNSELLTGNFDFASYTLSDSSIKNINKLSEYLKNNTDLKVQVEGHTDSMNIKGGNKYISLRRAVEVRDALVNQGISKDRISILSLEDTKPVTTDNNKESRALNRRFKINIISPRN